MQTPSSLLYCSRFIPRTLFRSLLGLLRLGQFLLPLQASDTGCYRFCSGYLWVHSSSGTTRPQQFLRDFVKAMMIEALIGLRQR
ncbi:hypothetical protein ANAPC1_00545 [Anaplasma phagocytophilum]|uniref:Uncharacterized protein n=1 Tax=Anaplasma phagocytophilum TaxID=948 RepID=A0AA45USQ0_ANAPH|nr:hypothetical protein ANAPC1_00545 [Anaplasma phagocytophilum]SCV61674.1 hypothetical protein ANAPH1_00052 [Anaplasma phagocytophilum]